VILLSSSLFSPYTSAVEVASDFSTSLKIDPERNVAKIHQLQRNKLPRTKKKIQEM